MSDRTTSLRPRGDDPHHVVYVCTDPGVPVYGRKGCSVHVQSVLRELVRRGAEVDLIAVRTGGPAPAGLEDVRLHELGRPRSDDAAEGERLLVDLDRRAAGLTATLLAAADVRPALVYQRYSLFGAEVMEAAAALGVPGVLEVNAPLVDEQLQHRVLVDVVGARDRTTRALRAATVSYAVSAPVASWAEDLAADGRPVPVVANGVDVARFAVRPAVDTAGPNPTGRLTVAFVGTFRPWHGVDLLVEAAARLGPHRVRLLLVGDGPQRATVLRRAAEAGVQVEAPGAVDPRCVPGLLARADIAVAPYPAGGTYFSPLKVMEYLAAGLPTVAAAVSDLGTVLRDGEELLLVPAGDLEALTDALDLLLGRPDLRARLGSAGRAAVTDRLTWGSVVDTVVSLVAAAAAGRRHPVGAAS